MYTPPKQKMAQDYLIDTSLYHQMHYTSNQKSPHDIFSQLWRMDFQRRKLQPFMYDIEQVDADKFHC